MSEPTRALEIPRKQEAQWADLKDSVAAEIEQLHDAATRLSPGQVVKAPYFCRALVIIYYSRKKPARAFA